MSLPPRRPRRRRRGGLTTTSLLLLGLILGLAGGLYYAWIVAPVVFVDVSPARLDDDYRAEYLFLVSQAYAADGDLARAQGRLAALEAGDNLALVEAELERYVRAGRPAEEVGHLAALAADLGSSAPAVALFAPTPAQPPTPTLAAGPATATATATLLPTLTPTSLPTNTPPPSVTPFPSSTPPPTAAFNYRLLSQERACDPNRPLPLIQVVVLSANLEQVPGVAVRVTWADGGDQFYTGFRPDEGPGYGDFTMNPGLSYEVTLVEGSPTVGGLQVADCPLEEGGLPGGWRLTFQDLRLTDEGSTEE